MKIIYKTSHDTVSVLTPASEWVLESGKIFKDLTGDELTAAMEELAQKDVPPGLKYKIVEDSVVYGEGKDHLTTDRAFRDAWEVDEKLLTDGVGSNSGVTADPPVRPFKD